VVLEHVAHAGAEHAPPLAGPLRGAVPAAWLIPVLAPERAAGLGRSPHVMPVAPRQPVPVAMGTTGAGLRATPRDVEGVIAPGDRRLLGHVASSGALYGRDLTPRPLSEAERGS